MIYHSKEEDDMHKIRKIPTILILLLLILCMIPKCVNAEEYDYEHFSWSSYHYIVPCAKQTANGENLPAMCISFYCDNGWYDYAEIFRLTSKNGKAVKVGTIDSYNSLFYDTDIIPNKTYYYYAIPHWNASSDQPAYIGERSQTIEGKLTLQRAALVDISTEKNKITLMLPAYDIKANALMIPMNYAQYITGFEIYRSYSWDNGYKKIATASVDQKTYIDKSVKKGTYYYYRIKAYYYDKKTKKYYYGEQSESMQIEAGGKNFPSQNNVNLKIQMLDNSTAKITWKNIKGFKWDKIDLYSYDGGEYNKLCRTIYPKKGQTSSTIKGLKTVHEYSVYGLLRESTVHTLKGQMTKTSDSKWYKANVYNGLCSALNLQAEVTSCTYDHEAYQADRTYHLTWNQLSLVDGYKIYINSYGSDEFDFVKDIKGYKNTSTDITIHDTADRNYSDIKIVAYKGNKTVNHVIYTHIQPASITTDQITLSKESNAVKITWSDLRTYGVSKYRVYRSTYTSDISPDFNYPTKQIAYLVGETTDTSISDNTLTKKGTYTYVVIPVFDNNVSAKYDMKNGKSIKY